MLGRAGREREGGRYKKEGGRDGKAENEGKERWQRL